MGGKKKGKRKMEKMTVNEEKEIRAVFFRLGWGDDEGYAGDGK